MSTNATIEDEIRDALVLDPRIPEPAEIAVSAEAVTATLRGTVGSFGQRRAAVDDTKNVEGVYDVDDELQVRLLNDSRRDDADIRGIALQILMWDVEVPSDLIDVKVKDGLDHPHGRGQLPVRERRRVGRRGLSLGVVGVTNQIKVVTP